MRFSNSKKFSFCDLQSQLRGDCRLLVVAPPTIEDGPSLALTSALAPGVSRGGTVVAALLLLLLLAILC